MSVYNDPIRVDGFISEDNFTMQCDNCMDELDDFALFDDMIEVAKRSGWILKKDEWGEWYHYCPACAKKLHLKIGPSAAQDFEGVGTR